MAIGLTCSLFAGCTSEKKHSDSQPTTTSPYPDKGWPFIHQNPQNSDRSNEPGATSLHMVGQVLDGHAIGAVLTTDQDSQFFVTTGNPDEKGCFLFAVSLNNGQTNWCSSKLGPAVVAFSASLDPDGNLYVADREHMYSFDNAGKFRWRTKIEGFALSSQFLSDGTLIFVTYSGVAYLLDRSSGDIQYSLDLIPGEETNPETNPIDCLGGDAQSGCYSANTLALDPKTDRSFLTLAKPGQSQAGVVALDYSPERPGLEIAWEQAGLTGGTAASPTISEDGARIYTHDLDDNLVALDSKTGDLVWTKGLGFSPQGSPTLANGIIIPSGAANGGIVGVRDEGKRAEVVWENTSIVGRGVPARTTNGLSYVAGIEPGDKDLTIFVLDDQDGSEVSRLGLPGSGQISIGTTIGPNQEVLVAGLTTGVFLTHPD